MRAPSSIIYYIDFIYLAATVYACNLNRVQLHVLDETMRRRTTLLHIATSIVIFIFFVKLLLIFVLAVFRLLRYFHIFFAFESILWTHWIYHWKFFVQFIRSLLLLLLVSCLITSFWLQVNWRRWDFDQWTNRPNCFSIFPFHLHTHSAHIPSCLQLVKNKSV